MCLSAQVDGVNGMKPMHRELLVQEFGRRLKLPYPMELAEMLEEALEIYRQNFATLFGLALVPALIGVVFGTILNIWQMLPARGHEVLLIVAIAVTYTLLLLVAFIGYGAQIWAVGQAIMGKPVGFGEAWMAVLNRSGALLLTMTLSSLPAIAGLALCCVGIIFTVTVFLAVLEQIVLLEGLAYFRAIKRHFQLVYPDWVRVLAFYFVVSFLMVVVQLLVGWGGMVFAFAVELGREVFPLPSQVAFLTVSQLWQQLANALVSPYWSAFMTSLYFDLRARREAFDLQVLTERFFAEPGSEAERTG